MRESLKRRLIWLGDTRRLTMIIALVVLVVMSWMFRYSITAIGPYGYVKHDRWSGSTEFCISSSPC
jgi:hypothetical protein